MARLSYRLLSAGGKFDLKPSAVSDDEMLHQGVIVCALGARYSSYCSNVARTFIIDPTDAQQTEYQALLKAQAAAIAKLKDGNTVRILHNPHPLLALDAETSSY